MKTPLKEKLLVAAAAIAVFATAMFGGHLLMSFLAGVFDGSKSGSEIAENDPNFDPLLFSDGTDQPETVEPEEAQTDETEPESESGPEVIAEATVEEEETEETATEEEETEVEFRSAVIEAPVDTPSETPADLFAELTDAEQVFTSDPAIPADDSATPSGAPTTAPPSVVVTDPAESPPVESPPVAPPANTLLDLDVDAGGLLGANVSAGSDGIGVNAQVVGAEVDLQLGGETLGNTVSTLGSTVTETVGGLTGATAQTVRTVPEVVNSVTQPLLGETASPPASGGAQSAVQAVTETVAGTVEAVPEVVNSLTQPTAAPDSVSAARQQAQSSTTAMNYSNALAGSVSGLIGGMNAPSSATSNRVQLRQNEGSMTLPNGAQVGIPAGTGVIRSNGRVILSSATNTATTAVNSVVNTASISPAPITPAVPSGAAGVSSITTPVRNVVGSTVGGAVGTVNSVVPAATNTIREATSIIPSTGVNLNLGPANIRLNLGTP